MSKKIKRFIITKVFVTKINPTQGFLRALKLRKKKKLHQKILDKHYVIKHRINIDACMRD